MDNILIIKTGAAGDVVRTTSLLNVLKGNIYWVTSASNKLLLPDDWPGLTVFTPGEALHSLKGIAFDMTISLEEDKECGKLAREIQTKQLAGVYLDDNDKISYTDNAAYWFDMSRVSRWGLAKANQLKAENTLCYQDCIFKMAGQKFNGEPYRIYTNKDIQPAGKLIGIERRSGGVWPDKQWWGYDKLIQKLEEEGPPIKVFIQRNSLRDYLDDIAACSHVVSGDSLAMHIALAYGRACTAIFNCTSPQEIYDYGLLKKVVSPLLNKYFYAVSYDKEVIASVPLDEVYKTLPV